MRVISSPLSQAETIDFGGGKDVALATLSLGSVAVAETVPTGAVLQYACLGVAAVTGTIFSVRLWRSEAAENFLTA